jgi:hypothetical protein
LDRGFYFSSLIFRVLKTFSIFLEKLHLLEGITWDEGELFKKEWRKVGDCGTF